VKIDSSTSSNVSPLQGAAPVNAQSGQAADTSAADAVASTGSTSAAEKDVSLSALSTNLLSLGSASNDDIDLTKVNAIRSALQNGTLQIDPAKIADGVLQSTRELIQKPSQS
jgi:negative regulator of flagellin synthesis FlgM